MSCKMVALTSKLTLTTSYTLPFSTSPFTVIFDELTDPFLFSFFHWKWSASCLLSVGGVSLSGGKNRSALCQPLLWVWKSSFVMKYTWINKTK